MGLVKNTDLAAGITLPNAYYRIGTVGGTKVSQAIILCLFASQEAYQSGKDCLEQTYYYFEPDISENSPNFIRQGYEYLKSLDEFLEAIDA